MVVSEFLIEQLTFIAVWLQNQLLCQYHAVEQQNTGVRIIRPHSDIPSHNCCTVIELLITVVAEAVVGEHMVLQQ
jgi:hypothetical protein